MRRCDVPPPPPPPPLLLMLLLLSWSRFASLALDQQRQRQRQQQQQQDGARGSARSESLWRKDFMTKGEKKEQTKELRLRGLGEM
jgi:hypothetical protein